MVVLQLQILQLILIAQGIEYSNKGNEKPIKYFLCGGGRKNSFLIESIKNYLTNKKI